MGSVISGLCSVWQVMQRRASSFATRSALRGPASFVERNPSRLADSAIYLEVGDEDGFGFAEGVDFMHRLL